MRNISLDILKLVLSFFVIGLHCAFYKDHDRDIAHMLNNGLFRIGVPLFLIINGYFFYSIKTSAQFRKWVRRILMLYVFWMICYIPIWQPKLRPMTLISVFNGYFHLWYIVNLLYAALCFWMMRKLDNRLRNAVVISLFTIGLALQYVGNYIITDDTTFVGNLLDFTPLYRNFLFMCLPLFYLGYKLNETQIKFSSTALILASVLLLAEIWLNMLFADYEGFDILLSLVVFCPIVFVKIRDLQIMSENKYVSLVSSSVFLTHPIFMYLLQQKGITAQTPLTIYTILLAVAFSVVVIPINKRLKFIL